MKLIIRRVNIEFLVDLYFCALQYLGDGVVVTLSIRPNDDFCHEIHKESTSKRKLQRS